MSGARLVAAAACVALSAGTAPAGDGGLPGPLQHANAATEAAATLRAEIEVLAKGAGDPRTEASVAFRRIAFDLLFRGSSVEGGHASVMAGFRLSWLRAEVDAALRSAPADAVAAAALRDASAEFAKAAAHGIDRPPPPDRPERSLRALLEPLDRAIAATGGDPREPGTAWPAPSDLGRPQTDAAAKWHDGRAAAGAPADDAERIAAMPGWVAALKACNARAATQFASSAKAWAAALRDRSRQATARASIDAFAADLPFALETGFEKAIRSGDAAARAACAGRPDDLLRELERRRSAWAAGWANGRGSATARAEMLQAARVAQDLAAVAQVMPRATANGADSDATLSSWGGAAVAPGGWRTHPKALEARAALALEAMLDGKSDAADRELAVLDRDLPIARLERVAADRLAAWLPGRAGLRARLRAAADGPGPEAWLGGARGDLMAMSRLLVEEARARAMGEEALATDLRSRAAAAAARALGATRLPE